MDEKTLRRTADALAALSFSEENAQLAALAADALRIEAAIASAQARCTALTRTEPHSKSLDAKVVADALLDAVDPRTAAGEGQTAEERATELATLRAAMGELRDRLAENVRAIGEVKRQAARRASTLAQPVVDALVEDIKVTASRLVDGFAAVSAMHGALRSFVTEEYVTRHALNGIIGSNRLLPWNRDAPVPAEIESLLRNLMGKGEAFSVNIPTRIALP